MVILVEKVLLDVKYYVILNYGRASVAYNFQTVDNNIKLLTEYESVTQEVLFGNAVLTALMSGRKYGVMPQNGDCYFGFSKQSPLSKRNVVTELNMEKIHPSDNAIRLWLKQFQETGSVLHRKGAGRPSTSQEDVDRIQEAFYRSPQKSTRRASVHLGIPQTTVWRVVRNHLHLQFSISDKTF
jgi:hypothetical protein